MKQWNNHKHILTLQFLLLFISFVLLLTACGSQPSAGTTSPPPNNSESQQRSNPINVSSSSMTHRSISVNLTHNPIGTTRLKWNPFSHILQVTLSLSGLAPNSQHPSHLHLGNCTGSQAVIYQLTSLKANGQGVATATTTIRKVLHGIPPTRSTGWFVNLNNGPTLSTELERRWLACGNISSVQTGPGGMQLAQGRLEATTSPDENAAGTAVLSQLGNQAKVIIQVHGLIPGSVHMAHIHKGSCSTQGPVVAPLTDVTVDANGNGTSTTMIPFPLIPTGLFYVNVHEGQMPKNSQQAILSQNFNPIVCGNIPLPH